VQPGPGVDAHGELRPGIDRLVRHGPIPRCSAKVAAVRAARPVPKSEMAGCAAKGNVEVSDALLVEETFSCTLRPVPVTRSRGKRLCKGIRGIGQKAYVRRALKPRSWKRRCVRSGSLTRKRARGDGPSPRWRAFAAGEKLPAVLTIGVGGMRKRSRS
jgi:hypothetical protein